MDIIILIKSIFPALLIVAVIAVLIIIVVTGYVKASPDTAYIISDLRKKTKILIEKL